MIELIRQPWPWYVSGPMIALVMGLLLFFGKTFGVSENLRTLCTLCGLGRKVSFFNISIKGYQWNLLFVLGALLGGTCSHFFLMDGNPVAISPETIQDLAAMGIVADNGILPEALFGNEQLFSLRVFPLLVLGGLLIGFGTRYAGGCTSGHAITGLSHLEWPSLVAVVGFFIGGLLMTHLLLPLLLGA